MSIPVDVLGPMNSGNPWVVVGSAITGLLTGGALFWKFFRSERVADANAGSEKEQIERLTGQLAEERNRNEQLWKTLQTTAEERNTQAGQLGAMTQQIAYMTEQITALRGEVARLQNQIKGGST